MVDLNVVVLYSAITETEEGRLLEWESFLNRGAF